MMRYELSELNRKLANVILIGAISEVNHADKLLRVQIGDNTTAWINNPCSIGKNFIAWRPLRVGAQVILACPSGEMSQSVIIGMLYSDDLPSPSSDENLDLMEFTDGAKISYNVETHALGAVLPSGATTQLVSDGGIAFTGDLTVIGNIHATAEVSDSARSMSGDRAIYNGHTHSDPQGGSVAATEQSQ
jgi:phage baseplate assembly protein V